MLIFAPVLAQLNINSCSLWSSARVNVKPKHQLNNSLTLETEKKEKETRFFLFSNVLFQCTLAEYLMEIYSVNKTESYVWRILKKKRIKKFCLALVSIFTWEKHQISGLMGERFWPNFWYFYLIYFFPSSVWFLKGDVKWKKMFVKST